MIVKFNLADYKIEVIKEAGDKRYKRGYALPESGFLYDVMQELKSQGYDVIKKRMAKDGHMMDDTQQYIRTRKYMTSPEGTFGEFAIYSRAYALVDLGEEYNKMKPGESMSGESFCIEM
jgi:hypothetical protein